ncbi:Protein ENHANCED DOWNY MILDEW 2 [Camellia lanceoleosa]|uniref:Protein ENHANCED DOWNY MILDEW 2 n=1 Tax=Camellia lanceoleosa TaxID=1840588 RepID=A0ACC0HWV8_9ERIC|nr:Protein ENHANCED DOWNY MILDEW 2 [Camellia lanceoleosa]
MEHSVTAFTRVLDEATVVLLFRDNVYLHPDKVSCSCWGCSITIMSLIYGTKTGIVKKQFLGLSSGMRRRSKKGQYPMLVMSVWGAGTVSNRLNIKDLHVSPYGRLVLLASMAWAATKLSSVIVYRSSSSNNNNNICRFCKAYSCEGRSMRSFHATVEASSESMWESLCLSDELVEAIQKKFCENCQKKQHQCFSYKELGSVDKLSGAEIRVLLEN